jgi:hypothetical protein
MNVLWWGGSPLGNIRENFEENFSGFEFAAETIFRKLSVKLEQLTF